MSRKSVGILIVVLVLASTLVGCLFSIPGMSKGELKGTVEVIDEAGNPIQKAVITIGDRSSLSGDDGKYAFTGAQQGDVVTVVKPGWDVLPKSNSIRKNGEAIQFIAYKEDSDSGSGSATYTVKGRVMDEQARGIPAAEVTFIFADNGTKIVITDAQGYYTCEGLYGRVAVTAEKDGYQITTTHTLTGAEGSADFLAKETTPSVYTVSGRVVDDQSRGIPSVSITFAGDATGTALTDAQGNFTRSGLTGSVKITATKDGYEIADSFDVDGPDDIIVFLAKATAPTVYTVSGRVVDDQGRGIPGVTITFSGDSTGMALTDAEGDFARGNLTGAVTIVAEKDGYDIDLSHKVNGPDDIEFLAIPMPYIVSGEVMSQGGLPIAGAIISLVDEVGRVQTVLSDPEGAFSISDLRGALTATITLEGWLFEEPPNSRVVNSEDLNFNFYGIPNMENTYTASGGILLVTGEPVPAVSVKFTLLDFAEPIEYHTMTTLEGVWMMDGLVGRVKITPIKEDYIFSPPYQIIDKGMQYLGFLATPI